MARALSQLTACVMAIAMVAAAAAFVLLNHNDDPQVIIMALPIVIAAYLSGLWSGLVATILSVLTTWIVLMPPAFSLRIQHTPHIARLVALAVLGIAVTALCERLRRSQRQTAISLARALRSEHRYAELCHAIAVPLAVVHQGARKLVDVNQAFVDLTGWSRDELLAVPAHTTMLRELTALGRVRDYETTICCKNGEVYDVAIAIDVVQIDGERHCAMLVNDVTERKRAQRAALESQRRLEEVTAAVRDVFWLIELPSRAVLYMSPEYETVWGRARAELACNPSAWFEAIHEDDKPALVEAMKNESAAPFFETEYRIVRPDGSLRWLRNRVFPLRDEHGTVVRLAGASTDITERRDLEEQLRQAQKLESLGMLAGGVAHDFNNVLAVIASCSGLLAEAMPASHEDRELVDEIEMAVQRATGLTRQLLAFSRKQVVEPVVLDLNAIVKDTYKMLRRMVGEDIILTTSLDPELSRVCVDPGYLVQVLMNLAVNARDAMPRGGTLQLITRNVENEIELAVCDSGIGMSAETKSRIFEPFFTTKGRGRGTGMGLAVVHGIVEQAGGRIDVDSELGKGTTMRVCFPIATAKAEAAREVHVTVQNGAETILVVDDDDYVRRSAARALRTRGYTVVEANDGPTALVALGRHPIDLLLTDIVMPGMDGRELAEATHIARPRARVLYMSGYTDDAVVRHGVEQREVALIEKPFRVDALAGKIREVLDA